MMMSPRLLMCSIVGHISRPDQRQRAGWHESEINRWIADPVAWRPRNEFDSFHEY